MAGGQATGFGPQRTIPANEAGTFSPPPKIHRAPRRIADDTPICVRHPRTHGIVCHTVAQWRALGVTRAELAQLLRQTRDEDRLGG